MVEFALILPILVLLLVMAIDFGRVFFGWVSLTNAARIGANYAAQFPDTWETGDADNNATYERLIADNLAGCDLQSRSNPSSSDVIDDPQFSDQNGDLDNNEAGDFALVQLSCRFDLITPLAGFIIGDQLTIGADSTFPIRAGDFTGPGGGGIGAPPCAGVRVPDVRTMTVQQASDFWTDSGFSGAFTADPTGQPDYIVQTQALTPTANIGDCVDPSSSVFVTAVAPPPCPSGQAQVPNLLNELVPDARTAWTDAGFTGSFSPASGFTTDVVLTQTTGPTDVAPGGCLSDSGSVTVTTGDPPVPQCPVPNMVGHTGTEAEQLWTTAGFTRSLTVQGRASNPVLTQDPQYPADVACDIQGKVKT